MSVLNSILKVWRVPPSPGYTHIIVPCHYTTTTTTSAVISIAFHSTITTKWYPKSFSTTHRSAHNRNSNDHGVLFTAVARFPDLGHVLFSIRYKHSYTYIYCMWFLFTPFTVFWGSNCRSIQMGPGWTRANISPLIMCVSNIIFIWHTQWSIW